MGCKFSITVDQQRPKTPSWLRKTSIDQTSQTKDDEEGSSSPEQVDVKTITKRAKKQTPSSASQWKP
jgi:hypothetical protein